MKSEDLAFSNGSQNRKAERQLLEKRVRANCSDIHGLTEHQFEKHIAGIVKVVLHARRLA